MSSRHAGRAAAERAVPESRTMCRAWGGEEDQNHNGSRADVGHYTVRLAGGHPWDQRKGEAYVDIAVLQGRVSQALILQAAPLYPLPCPLAGSFQLPATSSGGHVDGDG